VSRAEERRLRRAAAQRVLDELALDYVDRANVDRAPMFGSEGLRVNSKFFAFVGADGQLIVKVPAVQATALVARGEAIQVRAGRNATREWIGVPVPDDHNKAERWRALLADAYRYVGSLS
jgi:TfoX/Sxy family transcriptional regulator of competence genes